MAIIIEPQMLIDVLFPSGTTPARKAYQSKKIFGGSIELPEVIQLSGANRVRLAALLFEAPCFDLRQQEVSNLLGIDRTNISRWHWKRDAAPDKYRDTWRDTTITLVAIYFKRSREMRLSRDIFSYIQTAIDGFASVSIEDIFEWRGVNNMPSKRHPLPYASEFVEILKTKGLLTDDKSEKALDVLSQDLEATVKHFQKGLSLNTDQIATILQSPPHPHFLRGLMAYGQYIRLRAGKPPAPTPKKTQTYVPENKPKPAATQGSLNPGQDRG